MSLKIKQLRKERKMTQEDLGKVINQSKSNISKYENGLLEPNIQTLNDIANFFDVSMDYLLCRSDNRKANTSEPLMAAHSTEELTQDEQEQLIKYAQFLKSQRK